MNGAEPQQLLPAKLRWQSHEPTYLRPVAVEHPALRELAGLADTRAVVGVPVFKYWELEPGAEPAEVVATFANGKPAIVERQIGSRPRADDDDVGLRSARTTIPGTCCRRRPIRGRSSRWRTASPTTWPARAKRSSITWPARRSCCRSRRASKCRATCSTARFAAPCGNR